MKIVNSNKNSEKSSLNKKIEPSNIILYFLIEKDIGLLI
jgi:hypothetical protein